MTEPQSRAPRPNPRRFENKSDSIFLEPAVRVVLNGDGQQVGCVAAVDVRINGVVD